MDDSRVLMGPVAAEMDWRRIKQDLALASSYHVMTKLVGYLVLVLLIRYLDQSRMGEFFFAAALATFVAVFAELGVRNELTRSVAGRPGEGLERLSRVLSIQIPLTGFAFVLIGVFSAAFMPDIATILLLTSAYVLLQQVYLTFGAYFLAVRQVTYRVATGVGGQLVLAGAVLAAVGLDGSLEAILWCYIGANALLVGVAILTVVVKFGKLRLEWDADSARGILRASFPLFVMMFLGMVHFKVDSLMLGFMRSYQEVAVYESAYKLLEASRAFLRPGLMIFFPICAGLVARREWDAFSLLTHRLLLAALGIAVVLMIGAFVTADVVVAFLFGPSYRDSAPVLRVLFLTAPALFLAVVTTYLVSTLHFERPATNIFLTSLTINVGLNVLVIPIWGARGAAWTTFVSENVLAAGLLWLVLTRPRGRGALFESTAGESDLQPAVQTNERRGPDEEAS